MREVIVDLHKMDGLIQVSNLQYGHDEAANLYYAQVLEEHGVTQAQFDSSLVWYTDHPQLFDKIYPKVIAQLEREKGEFLTAHTEELNLLPNTHDDRPDKDKGQALTEEQLDSLLWVIENGYPSMWQPLPRPFKGPLVHYLID